ncbi:MAG TPA: mechanosensitive ion channel family protein [Candidatus Binatia bacterium]|nr:mechanosensitive ion channel family protein [Candidatus Binatia bacterium]
MAPVPPLVWPLVGFVVAAVAALVLRGAVLAVLGRWGRGANGLAALLEAVRLPSLLWALVLALFVALEIAGEYAHLPRRLAQQLSVVLEAAIIVSVTLTVAGVAGTLITRAGERGALGGPVTGLARTASRGLVLVVGFLVLLSALGIQITPILTALGVGGLAVALALQDTLSNLFAGMHLLADRPIRVGDYVKIADTIEGFVVDVGWRSTRVRMLQNNVVIVPNKRVAESIIINYDLPEPRMALLVPVGVAYGSDPDHVERVLVEEATRAAGEVPGLLADPPPFVRFIPGFGAYSLDFTLICQVATFVDQYTAQHELRKRILRRLRAEGIEIPLPMRTVELRQPGPLPHDGQQRQRAEHDRG